MSMVALRSDAPTTSKIPFTLVIFFSPELVRTSGNLTFTPFEYHQKITKKKMKFKIKGISPLLCKNVNKFSRFFFRFP